jgi:hypothetical protein
MYASTGRELEKEWKTQHLRMHDKSLMHSGSSDGNVKY